jgi:acetyltransferase-like isoleucine patch superfamily enzyme
MLTELRDFIKRNGFKSVFAHVVEIYAGFIFRYLPGIEGLFLRSFLYRMLFSHCGKGLIIYPNVYVIFSHRISVGTRVAINTGTYVDGRGTIKIGNYVLIGPNCVISSCGHGFKRLDIPMYRQPVEYGQVTIDDDVWIGANVTIKQGVHIHKGSIIAAGAVVTKDVPEYCVYGGVPAKFLSDRKEAV